MNGSNRSLEFSGMDYPETKKKRNFAGKILCAAMLTVMCVYILKNSSGFTTQPRSFSRHEPGVTHVLVTGGAGFIGSPAALRLLKDSYRVTIVDNLSWGNFGAVKVLQEQFPEPGRLQFIYADLGDPKAVSLIFQYKIFRENAFDAVMHFAAVAYVGEIVIEAMAAHGVKTLIYSIIPINPYGKAKKMAEDIILDFLKNTVMAVMILRAPVSHLRQLLILGYETSNVTNSGGIKGIKYETSDSINKFIPLTYHPKNRVIFSPSAENRIFILLLHELITQVKKKPWQKNIADKYVKI
ncbi:hypothetical protein MKW98_013463 [Papaver atlanticum]|uniref:NAD(P)-binding domain-containing protein n=1 Tax=Papaver atlanticum TaxID=357466 RepID=A0AAD4XKW1_9MAGN|nr:hypothetical protein MKW98_013463 [Papaver atlanticum]